MANDIIFFTMEETSENLADLKEKISNALPNEAEYMLNYPVVYIHVWQSKENKKDGVFSIYIGETTDIVKRTNQHYANSNNPENWQYHLTHDGCTPKLYLFGCKHFNKSLTLDLENRLIDYCMSMDTAEILNGRGNPQGHYSNEDSLDEIFGKIWRRLRREDKEEGRKLFLSETAIVKSAIYKASPNHKLTVSQTDIKNRIMQRVVDAIQSNKTRQLIFVEGDTGTGKTVLTSSTFYELLDLELFSERRDRCCLLVNHDEQLRVYQTMATKLGFKKEIVGKPTRFINNFSPTAEVDFVFIDEAHLLLTQGKQAYKGTNQLNDIIERAKVTVVMFDENQILNKGQYWELARLQAKREYSKSQGNYMKLEEQLRMNCSDATREWIDTLTKDLKIKDLVLNKSNKDEKKYEIQICDTPSEIHDAIRKKAKSEGTQLSRLIATYDWEYKENSPTDNPTWYVTIDGWRLPWNNQRDEIATKGWDRRKKRKIKELAWAEKPYTIDEVGSIFTIQGFDLQYAGLIIGNSVQYNHQSETLFFDREKKCYDGMTDRRTISSGGTIDVSNELMKHELRVLMTRGTKGLYIYACDKALREKLKASIKKG